MADTVLFKRKSHGHPMKGELEKNLPANVKVNFKFKTKLINSKRLKGHDQRHQSHMINVNIGDQFLQSSQVLLNTVVKGVSYKS